MPNSTEADGGVAGIADPTEFLSSRPGSFDAVNEQLRVRSLLQGVKFNAPLPTVVRSGWARATAPGRDQYNSLQTPDRDYVGATSSVPYAGLPSNREFNAPGFIIADPKIMTEVDKVTQGQSTWVTNETKYGFRFHFNPEVYAERYARQMDVNWLSYLQTLAQSSIPPASSYTGTTLTLNLLLARRDDVRICAREDYADFYTTITPEDRELIRTMGTMYDLEYLFRVINGDPMETWHGTSADFGFMMNRAVVISVGNSPGARKLRGIINNMGWTHQQFAPGMVPVYTQLTLNISRIPDLYDHSAPDALAANSAELFASGSSSWQSGNDAPDGGGGNSGGIPAPVLAGDAGIVVAYARSLMGTFDYVNVRPANLQTGMDCSAFVWWCYNQMFPGSMGPEIGYTGTQVNLGREVSRSNIKAGDLVFYGDPVRTLPGAHVAMYQGNGTVIHSSGTGTRQATEAGIDAAGGGLAITSIRRILEDR